MINSITKERELCYVVKVDNIKPIEEKDRVECAVVGGWTCMVPKGVFQPGSLGIYFEIDSQVDTNKECFAFLEKYHGKIKTQKFKTFYSQGLLLPFQHFDKEGFQSYMEDNGLVGYMNGKYYKEGDFLTKELGVTYADPIDNKRKAASADKYKLMCGRHPKVFRNPLIRKIYKYTWGKKLLFIFFGRGAKKKEWPSWVVKTDEERIQNLVPRIPEFQSEEWIATEKIDGTSTTFTMRAKDKKLIVCSRNVVMNQPGKDKTCYYAETDGNVYVEMAKKYDIENVLKTILKDDKNINFITVQSETYGGSIQKRNYSISGHDMAVFNVIIGLKDGTAIRLNPYNGAAMMSSFNIPYVPIIGKVNLPSTCEEILAMAAGPSALDGLPREGLVFRSVDGSRSFKAVDNAFITKYH